MGVLTVLHVMKGSPAEAAGLQAGDELVAAGDVSGELLTRAFLRDLQTRPAGTKVALQLKRGDRMYRQEVSSPPSSRNLIEDTQRSSPERETSSPDRNASAIL